MKKIILLISLVFIVKISLSQTNQPVYIIPTINTLFKQTIASGSLIITADSNRTFTINTPLPSGSALLSIPKIRAFPMAQVGNFYMINEKFTPTKHLLGFMLMDGVKLWQMGLRAEADTAIEMSFTPVVLESSSGFSLHKDSAVMGMANGKKLTKFAFTSFN